MYEIPIILANNGKIYYIGMTGRKFAKWLYEHKADIKYNRQSTAFERYCSKIRLNKYITRKQEFLGRALICIKV